MDKQIELYPRSGRLVNNNEKQTTDIHNRDESQSFMLGKQSQAQKHHITRYHLYETLTKTNLIYRDRKQINPRGGYGWERKPK